MKSTLTEWQVSLSNVQAQLAGFRIGPTQHRLHVYYDCPEKQQPLWLGRRALLVTRERCNRMYANQAAVP